MNIRNQLREAGVDTSKIIWFNTKSDGSRFSTDHKGTLMNGINFTFAGKGVIPSDTLYYRAHTPVRELRPGDFDWERSFGQGACVSSTRAASTPLSRPPHPSWRLRPCRQANAIRHLRRRRPELPLEGRAEQGARSRDQPQMAPHLGSSSATTAT